MNAVAVDVSACLTVFIVSTSPLAAFMSPPTLPHTTSPTLLCTVQTAPRNYGQRNWGMSYLKANTVGLFYLQGKHLAGGFRYVSL